MKFPLAFLLAAAALPAQDWKQLEFLLGHWTGVAGEKDTQIGAGQGAFSFELDLNKKIIVRRNNAQYTSGVIHDDLLIIYVEGSPRAIYFDSEGHVIRYNIRVPFENKVIFESEGPPKYRLTYWLDHDSLNGKFEIGDKTYMTWTSKRKK
jgi:hypothetical protein